MIPAGKGQVPLQRGTLASTQEYESKTASLMELREQLDRQTLLLQTLLRLLLEKGVIQRDELMQWIDFMDKADGRTDGKLQMPKSVSTCRECKRKIKPGAVKCQFCGTEVEVSWLMAEELFEERESAVASEGERSDESATEG